MTAKNSFYRQKQSPQKICFGENILQRPHKQPLLRNSVSVMVNWKNAFNHLFALELERSLMKVETCHTDFEFKKYFFTKKSAGSIGIKILIFK